MLNTKDTSSRKLVKIPSLMTLKVGWRLDINHINKCNIPNCDKFYKYKAQASVKNGKGETSEGQNSEICPQESIYIVKQGICPCGLPLPQDLLNHFRN